MPPTEPLTATSAEEWGEEIAQRYEWGRAISNDIATANDVPIAWFWQPAIEFRPAVEGEPEPSGREWARQRAEAILAAVGREVHDLSRTFDGVDEPLYWDGYHTNELGARLVADEMYEVLRPRLRSLASTSENRP